MEKNMNQEEIGKFIALCRKEKNLTQTQLAQKLHLTDRAVSKWETGKSMPDSSVMLKLCRILEITVDELLSAGKAAPQTKTAPDLHSKKATDKKRTTKGRILSAAFTVILFIGIFVCCICNLAISGRLTWAFLPASSILYAWLLFFPALLWQKRGIFIVLLSASIFTVPYLFLLGIFTKTAAVFSIGTATALPAIAFLWVIYAVFCRIGKTNKPAAFGITFLSAILLVFAINFILSEMIGEAILDYWDILSVLLLLVLALASFAYGRRKAH